MKKLIFYIFVVSLIFSGASFAVDKTSSKKTKKEPLKSEAKIQTDRSTGQIKPDSNKTQDNPRDYNNFIDKNNNGIDDRVENKRTKTPESDQGKPSGDSAQKDTSKTADK